MIHFFNTFIYLCEYLQVEGLATIHPSLWESERGPQSEFKSLGPVAGVFTHWAILPANFTSSQIVFYSNDFIKGSWIICVHFLSFIILTNEFTNFVLLLCPEMEPPFLSFPCLFPLSNGLFGFCCWVRNPTGKFLITIATFLPRMSCSLNPYSQ